MTLTKNYQMLGQTLLGSSYGDLYIRIYAKYNSQDETNLSSSVTYQSRLYFSGNYIYAQGSTKVVTSGTGATTTTTNWQNFEGRQDGRYDKGETIVKTITGTVYHNEEGKASISASANFSSDGSWGWSGIASGNADLPDIETRTLRLRVNNQWVKATPYLRLNNQWVKCKAYLRTNNEWKKGV